MLYSIDDPKIKSPDYSKDHLTSAFASGWHQPEYQNITIITLGLIVKSSDNEVPEEMRVDYDISLKSYMWFFSFIRYIYAVVINHLEIVTFP